MVELARLGVKTMIRTGGCGALQGDIPCGSFIINSGAVRCGGSSLCYVPKEFPAVADPFTVVALANKAKQLGFKTTIGVGATVDSYYEGQGRHASPLRTPRWGEEKISLFRDSGVLNMDMETETIFTIAYVLKVKAASILAVHGNRVTNEWLVDYGPAQKNLVLTALETLADL